MCRERSLPADGLYTALRDWVNTAGIDVSFSLVVPGKSTEK
jgi:hypothetical protein